MPSARHARMMRTAISPRLAMRRRRMGFTVRPEASMVDDRNDQRLAEHDLFGPQGVSPPHQRPHPTRAERVERNLAATASSWAVADLATRPPTSNRIVPVNPHSAKSCLARAGSYQ